MGSGASADKSTQQSGPPQWLQDQLQQLSGRANTLSQQPLQQYSGPLVQGFTPDQQQAFNTVNNAQGMAQPYINSGANYLASSTGNAFDGAPQLSNAQTTQMGQQGAGLVGQAANTNVAGAGRPGANMAVQGVGAGLAGAGAGINAANSAANQKYDVSQYMSPYTQQVVDATQKQFSNQNQQQNQQLVGNAISSGAWGGDRAEIAQAELANQQQMAQAPVIAGLYNQGYGNAQQEFNTQQALRAQTGLQTGQLGLAGGQLASQTGQGLAGLGQSAAATQGQLGLAGGQSLMNEFNQQQQAHLQANENQNALSAQAGFGMANLGQAAQNAALTGAQAQLTTGGLQQQLGQEQLNIPYEQFQQQQAYPYQQMNWLTGIDTGLAGSAGGTATTTTPGPSESSQILGGLGSAAAIAALFMNRGGLVHRASGGPVDTVPDVNVNFMGAPSQFTRGNAPQPNAPQARKDDSSGDALSSLGGMSGKFKGLFGGSSVPNGGITAPSDLAYGSLSPGFGEVAMFGHGGLVPHMAEGGTAVGSAVGQAVHDVVPNQHGAAPFITGSSKAPQVSSALFDRPTGWDAGGGSPGWFQPMAQYKPEGTKALTTTDTTNKLPDAPSWANSTSKITQDQTDQLFKTMLGRTPGDYASEIVGKQNVGDVYKGILGSPEYQGLLSAGKVPGETQSSSTSITGYEYPHTTYTPPGLAGATPTTMPTVNGLDLSRITGNLPLKKGGVVPFPVKRRPFGGLIGDSSDSTINDDTAPDQAGLVPKIAMNGPIPTAPANDDHEPQQPMKATGTTGLAPPPAAASQQQADPQDIISQYLNAPAPDPYKPMDTSALKEGIQHPHVDPWMAILQGSLATMGGTSPHAMVNIGKGAQQGLAEYQREKQESIQGAEKAFDAEERARKLADEAERWRAANAAAKEGAAEHVVTQRETGRHDLATEDYQRQEARLRGQQMQLEMEKIGGEAKWKYNAWMQAHPGDVNGALKYAQGFAGANVVIGAGQGLYDRGTGEFVAPNAAAPGAAQPGQAGATEPADIKPKVAPAGVLPMDQEIPSYKVPVSPSAAPWEKEGMVDVVKNAANEMKEVDKAATAATGSRAELGNLYNLLADPGMVTNKFAPFRATLSAYINGATEDPHLAQSITGIDPAKADVFNKDATRMGLLFARQTEGAREAVAAIKIALNANPSMSNTTEGNREIIKLLDATNARVLDEQKYAQAWFQKNRSYAGFQPWFNSTHPAAEYTSRVIPYHLPLSADGKGVDTARLLPNVTYTSKKGPVYWDGTTFVPWGQ